LKKKSDDDDDDTSPSAEKMIMLLTVEIARLDVDDGATTITDDTLR
jgi:hypothetical protein